MYSIAVPIPISSTCETIEAAKGSQADVRRSGTLDRMCYSAKLTQSLKECLRLTGAVADLTQIETVYERRLTDSSVRIPRGFERNFDEPSNQDTLSEIAPYNSLQPIAPRGGLSG